MTISEIFHSIQGESTRAGLPCTFIRLTGCDLRCVYCDTAYAFHDGRPMTLEAIEAEVVRLGCRFVTVTGGEPLLQEDVFDLMSRLASSGYDVQVETSGAAGIARVDPRVRIIMDIKTPGSGMGHAVDWENLSRLKPGDEVKFVLMGRDDYAWARGALETHPIPAGIPVLLSPAHGVLDPRDLAEWMKADQVNARLQLQIHKYIWGEHVRGV